MRRLSLKKSFRSKIYTKNYSFNFSLLINQWKSYTEYYYSVYDFRYMIYYYSIYERRGYLVGFLWGVRKIIFCISIITKIEIATSRTVAWQILLQYSAKEDEGNFQVLLSFIAFKGRIMQKQTEVNYWSNYGSLAGVSAFHDTRNS